MEKLTSSLRNDPRTAPFPASILQVTQNEDLLISILSLLPTKSVIRFKSVSKQWLSLISQPSFSLLHVTHSPPQPPSALLFPHPNNPSLIHPFPLPLSNNCSFTPSSSLSFTNDPTGEIQIVQSCNGLLLCSSGTPWDGIDTRVFYVFNPTTKKFSTIHPPATRSGHVSLSIFTKINLAFDPSKSPDYKVLLVRRKADGGPNCFQFDIYCSKIQKWYRCGDMVEWPCFEVFCNGVYLDGAVYWASKCNGFLRFDIDREYFKVMQQLPGFRNRSSTVRYFGESCGRLFLVDARGLEFDVFEMGRDYSNWIPKFQVDLGRIFDAYPCVLSQSRGELFSEETRMSLISVVCDEGGLCLVFHVPGKILSYDVKSGGIKVIRDGFVGNVERIIPALVKGFGGYQHFDSLASV